MREKYVDERWPFTIAWPQHNGTVNVCTVNDRLNVTLPQVEAEQLVREWDRMQAALSRCALAFAEAAPEAFSDFWYGDAEMDTVGERKS